MTDANEPQNPAEQPEDVVEPDQSLPEVELEDLPDRLQAAARNAGWTRLMEVQRKALPYLLAERDLMVQSRTGSGKTGAFLLPMLDQIDPSRRSCQGLILVPTRELAKQVAAEAETLSGDSGIRVVPVYGGTKYGPQLEAFRQGAHIVVGTPGRVLDHLMRRALSLDGIRMLVFDEADRMMSMGFYPDMRQVQRFLPDRRVNAHMFSATFPPHVLGLADEFLTDPEFLSLSRDHVHVAETAHVYYVVPGTEKDRALIRVIEQENPASAIIFCNTKSKVHFVTIVLQRFGYDADELSADLSQGAREQVMAKLRAGDLRFLVATDIAARGIDIQELTAVIQYEPPEDHELYIHRAGRTGRAGAVGEALSLVSEIEKHDLLSIGKRYDIEFEARELPTDEDVQTVVAQRIIALLEAARRERDTLRVERMQRFLPLAKELAADDENGLELLAMLLDDYYQHHLHGPAPVSPTKRPPERRDEQDSGGGGGNRRRRRRRRN